MTAPEVNDCECGHQKFRHKGGKQGCRNCDLGCARYTPDTAAAAVEKTRVLTAVAEVCEDQAEQARAELGQPSTSARLAEVERQRDEACALSVELLRDTDRLREVERERDEMAGLRAEAVDQIRRVARARDLMQAELVTARGELEQLRAGMAQAHARGPRVDDLVFAADARHCAACGWTSNHETHPHPTTPVRVVISSNRRTNHVTAVTISPTFSKDSRPSNGLEEIADDLLKNQFEVHYVVGLVQYSGCSSSGPGEPLSPRVKFIGIEPLTGVDADNAKAILDDARKGRGLGRMEDNIPAPEAALFDFDGDGHPTISEAAETRLGPDGPREVPPPSGEEITAELDERRAKSAPATDPFTPDGDA